MVTLLPDGSRKTDADSSATLIAVGVLAATLAAVAHEAVGHGGACLASGHQVLRLTALFFRCSTGSDVTDVAGPTGSLVCGAAAFLAVSLRPWGATTRLFLLMLGAVALFWFFGQLAHDAALATDDWAFAATGPSRWPLVVAGALGYVATVRLCARQLERLGGPILRHVLIAYLASLASAVLAGLPWRGHEARAALEALSALGLAPAGLLWATWVVSRRPRIDVADGQSAGLIARSWGWIAVTLAVYAAFLLTQGRGLGPLA